MHNSNSILDGVSCGGHRAKSCSECDLEFADWCNGDCTLCNGLCVLTSESNCSAVQFEQIHPPTITGKLSSKAPFFLEIGNL